MDIKQLLKNSPLYPILVVESFLSTRKRQLVINFTAGLLLILFGLATFLTIGSDNLLQLAPKVWGLTCFGLAFYLMARMIEWYFNSSYYFDNVALNRYQPGDSFTFTVGRVLMSAKNNDVLQGFLTAKSGRRIMERCGVSDRIVDEFLAKRSPGQFYKLPLNADQVLKLRELAKFLLANDATFAQFLADQNINEEKLVGAAAWVVYEIEYGEYRKRWWSETNLSRLPGLAKDWGFGTTYYLDQYSWDLLYGLEFSSNLYEFSARGEEVNQVTSILSKSREANVFIIADAAGERMDIVWHLVRQIKDGEAPPALEHKRPVLFNSAVFLAHFKEKAELEQELLRILKEVQLAGNVILIFDNFITLLQGFRALKSDFLSLLYPYLSTTTVQVIGLASNDDFHRDLEGNGSLMALFDRIFIRPLPAESIIRNLEQTVWAIEKKHRLFFTYPALLAIVDGADKYFATSDSGDKAVDLLTEIIPWARQKGYKVIREEEVEELIGSKSGVPVGKIAPAEREKLLGLETNLQARVVGQKEAIMGVANALRRSRAGVRNDKKPVGSFLFLGPTGVGKTETAKAVAETMFGSEKNLLRLDMAEYQTSEGADKIIGSLADGEPGVLASLVREHPYGVLLLDEFEKAHPDVHNLFLTIFDEGYFTDKGGRQVSLRNLIIIATSNAGADLIWQMVRAGKKPEQEADTLINDLVTKAIFKPELLNRFDAVVIYHPLSPDELKQIARLLLGRLAKRLADKGITLEISDYLAGAVAKLGANEVFGARPMQRFIQDHIEQQIADSLVKGEIKSGSRVTFMPKTEAGEPELIVK